MLCVTLWIELHLAREVRQTSRHTTVVSSNDRTAAADLAMRSNTRKYDSYFKVVSCAALGLRRRLGVDSIGFGQAQFDSESPS